MLDIIIVEDNKEIGTLLCEFLRKEKFTVSIAETGEKAIEIFSGIYFTSIKRISSISCVITNGIYIIQKPLPFLCSQFKGVPFSDTKRPSPIRSYWRNASGNCASFCAAICTTPFTVSLALTFTSIRTIRFTSFCASFIASSSARTITSISTSSRT